MAGTIEFLGDEKVPNSVNVVRTFNIRLPNIFLMPEKANWFRSFFYVDKNAREFLTHIDKLKPIVNGRGSNMLYNEFFINDEDFRKFDSELKRPYNPKKSVAFFIPISCFSLLPRVTFDEDGVKPEGFAGSQIDVNTGKPTAENPFFLGPDKSVRAVRLTLWPSRVVPRSFTMKIVKPTPVYQTNQVGFTMFDTLAVNRTVTQFDRNGKQVGGVFGPIYETILPTELSKVDDSNGYAFCTGQHLLGMKEGEIREISLPKDGLGFYEVLRYELVKVTKG